VAAADFRRRAHVARLLDALRPARRRPGGWFGFDPLARAVLPAVSLLFLGCAAYGVSYLRMRSERPNRVFVASLLLILSLLSAGHQARHLGLLWITTEAATLATVPLLHFNGTPRAFEATWKYLLIGGTGIALSLLGSFCLGYASFYGGGSGDLTFAALVAQGAGLSRPWVLIAWVLVLVGYGTKMGLAPMHTWKPDAYGEAPGIVGAILAGGVTTVAFTAILRVRAVVGGCRRGRGRRRRCSRSGCFRCWCGAPPPWTRDFKRMLAYSSVEHMGILVIGAALGRVGVWAALFHVWSNSLTKGSLFLSAGNIRRAAGARTIDEVRGMSAITPRSAALFVAGMFAVTACPPFGPFFSELRVLRAAFETGHAITAAVFLGCLLFAFFGLTRLVFAIVDGGRARRRRRGLVRETRGRDPAALAPARVRAVAWAGDTPGACRTRGRQPSEQLFPAHEQLVTPFALSPTPPACPGRRARMADAGIPEYTAAELDRGARLCAWFGVPEGDATRVVAVIAFDADNTLAVGRSAPASGGYPALTTRTRRRTCSSARSGSSTASIRRGIRGSSRFEGRGGAPAMGNSSASDGREVHEVAVGPVHAGIIEPGHFRFQCAGEEVLHLEIALGYQHRGVERALVAGPHRARHEPDGGVAGDTTIGHATAYAWRHGGPFAGRGAAARAMAARACARARAAGQPHRRPRRAGQRRGVPAPASACGRIRGDFLNLTALLCGNRFGRGLVRPGGCRHDLEPRGSPAGRAPRDGPCRGGAGDRMALGRRLGARAIRGRRARYSQAGGGSRPWWAWRRGPAASCATSATTTRPAGTAWHRRRWRSGRAATCLRARGCAGWNCSARAVT
jgi:hydrogenase-4 component F